MALVIMGNDNQAYTIAIQVFDSIHLYICRPDTLAGA